MSSLAAKTWMPATSADMTVAEALLAFAAFRRAAEFVDLGKSLGREPASVGPVAAPLGDLFEREREGAAGRIDPGEPVGPLEGFDVGQAAVLEALQPHAAAARHLGYLIE